MKIFIACLGTLGDLHPYLSLGIELARRDHKVIILSDAGKRETVRRAGLGFEEVLSQANWERFASHPALWHADTCMSVLFKYLYVPAITPVYQQVVAGRDTGNTLLIGSAGVIGFKLAAEALKIPLIHVPLSPFQARLGADRKPAQGEHEIRALIDKYRSEIRLPPLQVPVLDWLSSADRTIAAYPEWFGRDADRRKPEGFSFANFLFDDGAYTEDQSEWVRFLGKGSAPMVFTMGTAMRHGEQFFRMAATTCIQLSLRAVFLTAYPEQLPHTLPDSIHTSRYIRLDRLLPLSEALIHHGGVGTCAQALKCGTPQLVLPMAFDQFDNAQRIKELGAGLVLADAGKSIPGLVSAIAELRQNSRLSVASKRLSERLVGVNGTVEVVNVLESHFVRHLD